jgi:hypothetical protein
MNTIELRSAILRKFYDRQPGDIGMDQLEQAFPETGNLQMANVCEQLFHCKATPKGSERSR